MSLISRFETRVLGGLARVSWVLVMGEWVELNKKISRKMEDAMGNEQGRGDGGRSKRAMTHNFLPFSTLTTLKMNFKNCFGCDQ